MAELTDGEKRAFELMFVKQMNPTAASLKLTAEGFPYTVNQLRVLKKNAFYKITDLATRHEVSGMLLDSKDNAESEFNNLVSKTKRLLDRMEQENQFSMQIALLREYKDQITIALKYFGQLQQSVSKVNAQQVNIINSMDITESLRNLKEMWFEQMDVSYENGRLIFNKPSPELVDSFNRWRSKQIKEAIPAEGL